MRQPAIVPQVGVVILGAGKSGRRHAKACARVTGLHVRGVFDSDPARAAVLAAEHGATAYRTLTDSLDQTGPVFALVCTPPATHPSLACKALEAGLDVLVEKPFAVDRAGLDAVARAANRTRRFAGAVAQHRFADGVSALDRQLARSGLEHVTGATVRIRRRRADKVFKTIPWRADASVSGGGVLISIGFHYLDLACRLFGSARATGIEDVAYRGGIETRIVARWTWQRVAGRIDASWGPDVADEPDRLALQGLRPAILAGGVLDGHGRADPVDLHARQLADFAEAICTRCRPAALLEDVRPALELIFDLYALAAVSGVPGHRPATDLYQR